MSAARLHTPIFYLRGALVRRLLYVFALPAFGLLLGLAHDLAAGEFKLEAGFTLLFNGKNLDGWREAKGNKDSLEGKTEAFKGRFKVADGKLVYDPAVKGDLYIETAKEFGKDVHIKFDFKPGDKCNNDFFLRGTKFDIIPGKGENKGAKEGEWSTLEIVVVGDKLEHKINGETVRTSKAKTATLSSCAPNSSAIEIKKYSREGITGRHLVPTSERRVWERGVIGNSLMTYSHSRRLALVLALLLACGWAARADEPIARNRIQAENEKPGSLDWQLTRVRLDKNDGFRSPLIEGYCSKQSVVAGDTLHFMVSTTPAARFKLEIFRTGYYAGRGARLMTTLGSLQGKPQTVPPVGERSLRECKWEPAASLKIPSDWLSGVYLGRLTTLPEKEIEPYWQSYVVFIVRDDRPADILFQCSDNTWQAYNRWPDNYSVYTDPKGTEGPWSDVSFDRPYAKYAQIYDNPQSIGSGEWLCFEFPLAYWLEKQGYDVAYCSNSDMLTPDRGLKCKAFLSVGHDEYWDIRCYDSVKSMRDAGVNLLFLSGNAVCWVTPLKPSTDGRPSRIMFRGGPYGGKYKLAEEREKEHGPFPERGPDEGYLIGARNVEPVNGGGDWICSKPDHWIFKDTGMKKGDRIPGLIGWEYHGDPPTDLAGLQIVAEGTAFQGVRTSAALDGHDLSRTQGQFRLQCLDHFLVASHECAAGAHAALVALEPAARSGRTRTEDHG